ncbi:putative threonyl-tRNA synthetase [Streptomyces sp. Tu6071]|nr:putative threonyl-tRNA synthetase [Streptomyces sp. Tu6071]
MRGRVPQDVETVLGGDLDGFDGLALAQHVREVPQLAVHAGGDDGALTGEEVGGRRPRRHHTLVPLGIALDDHTDV